MLYNPFGVNCLALGPLPVAVLKLLISLRQPSGTDAKRLVRIAYFVRGSYCYFTPQLIVSTPASFAASSIDVSVLLRTSPSKTSSTFVLLGAVDELAKLLRELPFLNDLILNADDRLVILQLDRHPNHLILDRLPW